MLCSFPQGRLLMDAALFAGRSFRVGWGPGWTLAHCGDRLGGACELAPPGEGAGGFGFLAKPARSKKYARTLRLETHTHTDTYIHTHKGLRC